MVSITDTRSVEKASDIIKSKKFGDIVNIRGVYGKSKIGKYEKDGDQEKTCWRWNFIRSRYSYVRYDKPFVGNIVEIKSMISNSFWNKDVEDNALHY